jgi:hypothetical protein
MEWPASNSDEATMGLMATHIAEGREFPNFMYGQSYMGTAESYLAAVLFWMFGPSLFALRVPMVLLFLAFLFVLYVLARRLYGTTVALISVGLLTLGSRELYGHQLVAQGAIPETLLTGSLLLLLGHRLLATAGDGDYSASRRRWLLAGWGVTAALGLWSTPLTAPFVATSAVLLWLTHRRRRQAGVRVPDGAWALAGGLIVGALPWILHDLTHPFSESATATLVGLYTSGGTGLNGATSPGLVRQVTNTVTTSLAYVTGGSAIAHPSSPPAWPSGFAGSWRPPTNNVFTTLWGLALIALWAAGVTTAVRALRRRQDTLTPGASNEESNVAVDRARMYGRLAMLTAAGVTVAMFAASPTPGVSPANNVRYIIGILVATPALIAPLWQLRRGAPQLRTAARTALLVLLAGTVVTGTVQVFRDATHDSGEAASRQLIQALRQHGITRVYSGYGDCNRLTFLSGEQIICAVLFEDSSGDNLIRGMDRYLPYRTAVEAEPGAAYMFRTGDHRNRVLARSTCQWRNHWQLVGYEIWQPAGQCPIPSNRTT